MAWITADEALKLLQVRPQTLYANVSRGRIRARADAQDPRRSRYHFDDVQRMAQRHQGRRKAEAIAADAIGWGDPVLPSAISTVAGGRLWYRGQDAAVLAESAQLEDVAGLLWGTAPLPAVAVPATPLPTLAAEQGHAAPLAHDAITRALLMLGGRVAHDLPSVHRSAAALQADAAEVFAATVQALLGTRPARPQHPAKSAQGPTHLARRIAQSWRRPRAEDAIRRALVLLADHELNASTFATRVSVSTGAALSAGVLAGLTTLTGPLHGGAAATLQRLLEAGQARGVEPVVRDWLARGHKLPGFGHPLYPEGDVRAVALLAGLALPPRHAELAACVLALAGEQPNVDFAMSAMCHSLKLPPQAPLTLFAIARCIGWLAHAMEQALQGHLIRPRARYTGPALPPEPPPTSQSRHPSQRAAAVAKKR